MSYLMTIARPYASAAFEYALHQHNLAGWDTMLQQAAFLAKQPDMAELLSNPRLTQKQLVDLFLEIIAKGLDRHQCNFLQLLAEYKRLPVLPPIASAFSALRAIHEKTITVDVISAISLDTFYQDKLMKRLHDRLQQKVLLNYTVDPSLLGGVMVRAGDLVIDGSVRGKLNRLLESL